jgi:hypothetical protein
VHYFLARAKQEKESRGALQVDVSLALASRACIVACRYTSGCKCTSDRGCPLSEGSAVLGVPAYRGERSGPATRVQPLKSPFPNSWKPNKDNVICSQPPHPISSLSTFPLITTHSFFAMLPGKFKIKKPSRTTHGGPSQGSESNEPETGNFDRPTSYEPSKARQGTSTTTQTPAGDKSGQQVRKPKPRFRPGDQSAGGINIGGESDDGDSPGAQAGRGDRPIGRDHLSGGPDDRPAGGVESHNPAQKSKLKPKTKRKEADADNRTAEDEPSASGDKEDTDPKIVPKPGGKHDTGEKSGHGEQSKDSSQPKPKAKPKRKAGEGSDRSEEDGDGAGDEEQTGGQTGMKKNKGVNPDGDNGLEEVDLGNEPETTPVKKKNASASSKIPDDFEDEGQDELSRLQSRINAIRKGGYRKAVALPDDDPELELVDMALADKFVIEARKQKLIAAEREKRKGKTLLPSNDEEMQKDIANALAETLKPKWPGYLAMGFKVAFALGDIALIVNGITDDFILIDIPAKEIIEGAVELYKRARETPEDKAAAIRNGRGESAAKLEKRRQEGMVALMELTGVDNLNKKQLDTYDRLRVLLAMQRKADNAEGAQNE